MVALLSYTEAGERTRPGSTISSPVEMIATRGRRTTRAAPRPIAASTPVSREVRIVPPRRTSSPRLMSVPAKLTPEPGVTGRETSNRPLSTRACSTITTASAPRGSHAPVAIGVAEPGPTAYRGSIPVATSSSLKRNAFGEPSEASNVSSARTA